MNTGLRDRRNEGDMINQKYLSVLGNTSVIREMAAYAAKRGEEIGPENVFNFSLGNPSVPAPDIYADTMIRLLREADPIRLHSYAPTLGVESVREQIAASLRRRFNIPYESIHIYPVTGAASALSHAMRAVGAPGQEIVIQAPYFSEYSQYVEGAGLVMKVVPANFEDFQIQFEEMEKAIGENTAAVLLNSPCNPSGTVFTEETLTRLAGMLKRKSEQFGHVIFLISDEPYREIVFDGKTVPYPSHYYDHTLSCYSFSKSQSVPGERIGYIAVNPACERADIMTALFGQISRGIGHNGPASLQVYTMGETIDVTSDLRVYEENMNILYDVFKRLGFTVQRPGGTFYILPKALEEDSVAFCKKALKHDLVFVPGDGFAAPGYFRVAYCVPTEKVKRSVAVIEKFCREEYGVT